MPTRHTDWIRQARRDLRHAQRSIEFGDYKTTRYLNGVEQGASMDYYPQTEAEKSVADQD